MLQRSIKTLPAVAGMALASWRHGRSQDPCKLAHSTWSGYGPFYVARDKGFFKRKGRHRVGGDGGPLAKMGALMAGQIDLVAQPSMNSRSYMTPARRCTYILAVDNSAATALWRPKTSRRSPTSKGQRRLPSRPDRCRSSSTPCSNRQGCRKKRRRSRQQRRRLIPGSPSPPNRSTQP